ncbi:MAG: hypothetical protein MZV65_21535 [Chromatiales bacterium]|nr:hypothetical protein [Chromatiales bacterium]
MHEEVSGISGRPDRGELGRDALQARRRTGLGLSVAGKAGTAGLRSRDRVPVPTTSLPCAAASTPTAPTTTRRRIRASTRCWSLVSQLPG